MKVNITPIQNLLNVFILWFFFSPSLLFKTDIRPWWMRVIMVVLSPITLIISTMLSFLFAIISSPTFGSWETPHEFHNAEEIAYMTNAPIPAFDTICAIYKQLGLECETVEKFYFRKDLTEHENIQLRLACTNEDCWTETDSTFEYKCQDSIMNPRTKNHYDYLKITIPKEGRIMVMKHGSY